MKGVPKRSQLSSHIQSSKASEVSGVSGISEESGVSEGSGVSEVSEMSEVLESPVMPVAFHRPPETIGPRTSWQIQLMPMGA